VGKLNKAYWPPIFKDAGDGILISLRRCAKILVVHELSTAKKSCTAVNCNDIYNRSCHPDYRVWSQWQKFAVLCCARNDFAVKSREKEQSANVNSVVCHL
jgi:hypothetical protein